MSFDERNVELIIGIPRAASYILTRLKIVKHINFAGGAHDIFDYFDKLLTGELLQCFVGDRSVQVST